MGAAARQRPTPWQTAHERRCARIVYPCPAASSVPLKTEGTTSVERFERNWWSVRGVLNELDAQAHDKRVAPDLRERWRALADDVAGYMLEEFEYTPRKPTPMRSGLLDDPPNRLRELRVWAGLRQREVLARMDVRLATCHLSNWELGKEPIPEDMIEPLARAFGVAPWELHNGATSSPLTLPDEWTASG